MYLFSSITSSSSSSFSTSKFWLCSERDLHLFSSWTYTSIWSLCSSRIFFFGAGGYLDLGRYFNGFFFCIYTPLSNYCKSASISSPWAPFCSSCDFCLGCNFWGPYIFWSYLNYFFGTLGFMEVIGIVVWDCVYAVSSSRNSGSYLDCRTLRFLLADVLREGFSSVG